MNRFCGSLICLLAFHLVGCVPYPVYKMVQPAAQVTVLDGTEKPVEAAAVTLITNFNPYGRETRQTKMTNHDGLAVFETRREWQRESVMIHGVTHYFWNWCIRKPGFKTYLTGYGSGSGFEEQPTIHLSRGASTECPSPLN